MTRSRYGFGSIYSFNNHGWLDDLPKSVLEDVNIVMGDVRDSNQMRSLIKEADHVLHLASLIAIPFFTVALLMLIQTFGTLNILQAARDFNVPVIHTSTSEVMALRNMFRLMRASCRGIALFGEIGADQIAMS